MQDYYISSNEPASEMFTSQSKKIGISQNRVSQKETNAICNAV